MAMPFSNDLQVQISSGIGVSRYHLKFASSIVGINVSNRMNYLL